MSSRQTRKSLTVLNETMRHQNMDLKSRQNQMLSHIQTLIRRQKQLSLLKQQLLDQLQKSQQIALKQNKIKQEKCIILQVQIKQLNQQLNTININIIRLQQQYKICLDQYDKVLAEISLIVENNKINQMELIQQKQKQTTIKAMIFDYQRLQRVLEEQRKYFKQLSNNQEKSHAERMKQFEKIKNKLIKEEKQTSHKKMLDIFKIGFIKLNEVFKRKYNQYAYHFIRGNYKFQKLTTLGISKLQNCLNIATMKYQKHIRNNFFIWHNKVFKKNVLNNIVQNTLKKSIQSKTKISIMNKMIQRLNSDHLSLLHLYQRTKIIMSTAGSRKHKQKHMAFNRWRQNSAILTKRKYYLQRISDKLIPFYQMRIGFNQLRNRIHLLKRFQIASHLLNQFQNTKQLARIMRKWRLQIHNRQRQIINKFIENIKIRNTIQSRLIYQKRKVKIITSLQLSMSKIQLRTYFLRYYHNVKQQNIITISNSIDETKDLFSEARKQNKYIKQSYLKKNLKTAAILMQKLLFKRQVNPYFKIWKNNAKDITIRNNSLLHLILRKQVMNEFRKVVQYYQKKQMHQVLTDLNNKMQTINQKSTQFRNQLKRTIQNLGNQSSKRIDQVSNYTLFCQKKLFFNWSSRVNIKTKFKYYLISRSIQIFTFFTYKNTLKTIQKYAKDNKKDQQIEVKQKKIQKTMIQKLTKKAFYGLLQQLKMHKKAFAKLIHVQNVMYFYRIQCGLVALRKRAHYENKKQEQKNTQKLNQQLLNKTNTLTSLKNDNRILQQKLRLVFQKFVNFQDLSMKNRDKNFIQQQKGKYFQVIRNKVRKIKQSNQILENFFYFIEFKNYFIFWKSLLVTKYQGQQQIIKQELSKINKKKKTLQQKALKTKNDIQRKLSQQTLEYTNKLSQASHFTEKHTNILNYYDRHHLQLQKNKYLREIFKTWKNQYFGTKNIVNSLQKILHRGQIIQPYKILYEQFKKYDSQHRSKLLCALLLQRKCKNMMIDGFNYWRYNMRHGYCEKIRYKIDNIDQYYESIKTEALTKAENISNQIIRNKYYNLKITIFMAFKNQWIKAKQNCKKIQPLQQKIQERRINDVMRNWKWLRYYKKTKRAYLKHKQLVNKRSLKSDVFNSLKIHRIELYNFFNAIQKLITNRRFQFLRFSMHKITNIASQQKNQLIHQRRRILHSLLMSKITKQRLIKRKLMWKWQSLLIPRTHYLPNILKSVQLRILKSSFSLINQKKYWHQYYVKQIAQKVTTQGYSDVNSITNILVREGFDPDQLKGYLEEKNKKDMKIITNVIGHLRTYPKKEQMVKAFHSWKEFVRIKKNIKRVLSKVFNFTSGLGRYFNKWRKKDPHFNQILIKQSRVNMLQRYKQLDRLMKQYRRDIKDSLQNCQQLRQINDEHSKSTHLTVQMAFSNLTHSINKGIKQGFQIWRINAKKQRNQQLNSRYDELVDGIQILDERKNKIKQRINKLKNQNRQLKQKCKYGQQCGELLKQLMSEKDGLTVDLAEKQHNLKILLEDNLRLKQKIKLAKDNALKLIHKIQSQSAQ